MRKIKNGGANPNSLESKTISRRSSSMSEHSREVFLNKHIEELTRGCFTPLFFKTETVEKLRKVAQHYGSTYQQIVDTIVNSLYKKIHEDDKKEEH
jgi:regulator of PEP synthase PpsR (kinase-PPPase family)